MSKLKNLLPSAAIVLGGIFLAACGSEPAPDFSSSVSVARVSGTADLRVNAWRGDGSKPCRVSIQGAEVSNWVKPSGALPRMTLAPAVVQACTGQTPYLSSLSVEPDGSAALWEQSSGPDSATAIATYRVRVSSLSSHRADLELHVLSGK